MTTEYEDLGPDIAPYVYKDHKWALRFLPLGSRVVIYVHGPYDDIDDGSLDSIFPWGEAMAKMGEPLFLFGDYEGLPKAWEDKWVFKTSCHCDQPKTMAFFFPVTLNNEPRPIGQCQYATGFQGTPNTHPCRHGLDKAILRLEPHYLNYNDKFWTEEEDKESLRQSYLVLLENTQFPLCPRGAGLNSTRFFEALRLGRIPVLISDHAKLPMESSINYSDFVIRVPEQDMEYASVYVQNWLANHDLEEASRKARSISLEHFSNIEDFIKVNYEQRQH